MMALELLDTKWAGVIQPDPDSAQPGEVETGAHIGPGRATAPHRHVPALRTCTATELARLLEDVGFAEIECLATSTGGALV